MSQAKKILTVLTVVSISMTSAAGFTTQAASRMPVAVTIDTSDKIMGETVLSLTTKKIPASQVTATKKAIGAAKAGYDKEQIQKAEEQKKKEEKARQSAEAAQKAQADEVQAKAQAQAKAPAGETAEGDMELLAAIIFCEAGNQPYDGQVAVGAVIMNRVQSGVYPNSISEVIYQSGQFGPAMTGWLNSILASKGYTETAMQAAADAMGGANPIGDCLYFGNGNYGIQIGDHFFH